MAQAPGGRPPERRAVPGPRGVDAMAQDDGDPLQLFELAGKPPPPGQTGQKGPKGLKSSRDGDRGRRRCASSPPRYSPPKRRRSPAARRRRPSARRRSGAGRRRRRRADSGSSSSRSSSSSSRSKGCRSRSGSSPRGGRSRSAPRGGRSGGGGGGGGGGLQRRRGEEITTLFVTGLPEDAADDDVRLAFDKECPVVRCNMMKRGPELVAFVRFENIPDMKRAMQCVREGKVEVQGSRLRAEIARQNTVTNGRT
uniref:RRM domain-containing protein n=1 Tax=Alexandrium monilatum TaxID=311494 RepID=A0A7S4QHH8_9DINO